MKEEKRNEICIELFNALVEKTDGSASDIIIILKKMLIGAVQSISETDNVSPELVNRTFESLAHELLSYGMATFTNMSLITLTDKS